MAIITKFSTCSCLEIMNIPEIKKYLNDLDNISHRLNSQNKSMVRRELGSDIFALEQVFETKELENCFYESHKKFVDIQIMFEGAEIMQLFDTSNRLANMISYDEQTDFCVYEVHPAIVTDLYMTTGDVFVFFPKDGHLGMLKSQNQSRVKKTVIKVPYEYFT